MNFSLNHDAVGTTYSGSFPCDDPADWTPHPESYWVQKQGPFDAWRFRAMLGDRYYVDSGVYWARVS